MTGRMWKGHGLVMPGACKQASTSPNMIKTGLLDLKQAVTPLCFSLALTAWH